jgi:hypothetical protein
MGIRMKMIGTPHGLIEQLLTDYTNQWRPDPVHRQELRRLLEWILTKADGRHR